jgi:hypothetical protein
VRFGGGADIRVTLCGLRSPLLCLVNMGVFRPCSRILIPGPHDWAIWVASGSRGSRADGSHLGGMKGLRRAGRHRPFRWVVWEKCSDQAPGTQVPKPPRCTTRAANRTCVLSRLFWGVCSMLLLRGFEPLSHPRTESSGVVWGGPSPPALARRVGCLEGLVMAQAVRCWLEMGWRRPRGAGSTGWRRGVDTRASLDPCRDVPRVPATLVP